MTVVSARAFQPLAARLGLEVVGYRAEGRAEDTTVTLMETRAADRTTTVSISIPHVRPLDLLLAISTGSAAPRARTEETLQTGDEELDAWVSVSGTGEADRARALLGDRVRVALRALDAATGVKLTDAHAVAHVSPTLAVDAQVEVLRRLIVLRDEVHASTRGVAAALSYRAALPAFQRHAAALGVESTTCPFGLFGSVDGCAVDVFRFIHAPSDRMLLVHVGFPTPLAGDFILNSHLGRSLRARAKGALGTLLAVGPTAGWFKFGTTFKVGSGSIRDIRAVTGSLMDVAKLADGTSGFLNVSGVRLVTGVRMGLEDANSDIVTSVRRLVRAATTLHHVANQDNKTPARTPYR